MSPIAKQYILNKNLGKPERIVGGSKYVSMNFKTPFEIQRFKYTQEPGQEISHNHI